MELESIILARALNDRNGVAPALASLLDMLAKMLNAPRVDKPQCHAGAAGYSSPLSQGTGRTHMNYMSPDAHLFDPDGKLVVPDDVQDAVRKLLRWAGEDPEREGLVDTPKRFARAWREYCQGHDEDPGVHLSRTFEEVGGYDEVVILRDIPFQSHCEHHLAPITGKASIAYLPRNRVVGISKLARVLQGYARRLQVQERLTAEVAGCIWQHLQPQGVCVVIEAQHGCMTGRGVMTPGVGMITTRVLGVYQEDPAARRDVLKLMGR
jgi:GTP cyclohydrolase I